MDKDNLLNHPFCTFVRKTVANNEVEKILSSFNRKLGFNMNILLFCCWLARTGYKNLTKENMQKLISSISIWHQQIILPLNKLARILEQNKQNNLCLAVRKKQSLAEQIEQLLLLDSLIKISYKRSPNQQFAAAYKNIVTYYKELQIRMKQQDGEAIKKLLAYIFPQVNPKQTKKYITPKYLQLKLDDIL